MLGTYAIFAFKDTLITIDFVCAGPRLSNVTPVVHWERVRMRGARALLCRQIRAHVDKASPADCLLAALPDHVIARLTSVACIFIDQLDRNGRASSRAHVQEIGEVDVSRHDIALPFSWTALVQQAPRQPDGISLFQLFAQYAEQ